MYIAKADNLCVQYGQFTALKDITFSLPIGSYLCIVGVNGSGKTTLVKTLLALEDKTSGEVATFATHIGYLPQHNSIKKDFPATVMEIILSGCNSKHIFCTKEDRLNAYSQVARLGLETLAKKSFATLSGGQKQRVLLARSLCALQLDLKDKEKERDANLRLLVLDEPVTGLDALITDELYAILDTLNKKYGVSVIMVSHDVKKAVKSATHILHLNNEAVFFGKTFDYVQTDAFHTMKHTQVCGG